ncbi:MAG: DUF1622 domain-containing protein [Ruminococcaceae bacterium]|nr:DUF1622 domain-containing protein [Oscillospiraceae bacterium]
MFENFIANYELLLRYIAQISICTLELVGIMIIIVGSAKTFYLTIKRIRKKQPVSIVIELGKSLSLALEFKMGAEIINTVIIRDLKELGILAVVIVIRALMAVLIHWEVKMEKKNHLMSEPEKK